MAVGKPTYRALEKVHIHICVLINSPKQIATLDLYVQAFFVRRLYYISGRKWWVAAPIAIVLAFAYAAMCLAVSLPGPYLLIIRLAAIRRITLRLEYQLHPSWHHGVCGLISTAYPYLIFDSYSCGSFWLRCRYVNHFGHG